MFLNNTEQLISTVKKLAGKKIGFTCSTFDLLHAGHHLMLKDSKDQCDILIVGLHTDPTIDVEYRKKTNDPGKTKNKPIQTFRERLIQIESCKYVDYIIKYSTEDDLLNILNTLKPDVRILGSDWKGKPYTGHTLENIQIHWHIRDHDYSTSNLRKRIFQIEKTNSS